MSTSQAQNSSTLQPEGHLTPQKDLSKIFPDIEGELCSRHSTLFGKLKTTFNKLYDNMEPSNYVIVKGNVHIIGKQTDEVELSMGMQNGVIIMVTRTYPQSNIFINGNHIDQQLILDSKGNIQEGLHELSAELQTICASALSGLQSNKLYGGIIYIHANIPEGFYNYKNALLTALFLSMLLINDRLGTYTIAEMVAKMSETKLVDQLFLEKQFYDYQNRYFSLMVGSAMYKVPLDSSIKLLFCRLDLAQRDIKHSQTNIKQQIEVRSQVTKLLFQNYGIKSFYQAFQSELEISINNLKVDEGQAIKKVEYLRVIQSQLRQLKSLCQYSNNKITFQQLICLKWQIDSKLRSYFSEEVVQLVESIRQKTGVKACTIVQGQYLMMAVQRRKYTELICMLRQLLHRGELKSKSCFKIEEELIDNRWGSEDNGVGEKIFVSVPSRGVAIFDPSQAIWFD